MRWVCSCGKFGLTCQLTGRFGDTMVCGLANDLHVGAGRYRSGRFAIPCGGVRGRSWSIYALHTGAGLCRSGRSAIPCGGCAGCSWARSGNVTDCREATAIPWSVGWQRLSRWCRSVPLGTLCDTMRWCAWSFVVNIGLCAGGRDASAIPPSGSVCLVAGWPQHIGGADALLGRSGDTMVCGWSNVLHTGAGRHRTGRFAIPCGGLVSGRVTNGWDVSAPNGWFRHFVLVSCYTCLRGASGARLLTFGKQLV